MKEEQIIEVARELFHKFGFKKVSMDEIAREAGVTKKTIYRYFDSKEALLRELKEELNYDLDENDLRIVRVIENFFVYKGKNIHEYLFVYLCDLDESLYNGDFKNLENDNITMNWVKEEAFILFDVKPGVVKGIIRNPNVEHIVLKDI